MVPHAGRVLAGRQGLVRTVVLGLGVDEAGRVLVEGRHELAQPTALLEVKHNQYQPLRSLSENPCNSNYGGLEEGLSS